MATLKDVAAYAGLSASTASIVLKGKGDARKIPKTTQDRIYRAARELGYTPNIQAQVLREGISAVSVITLFWASDNRVHMLSRFLNGLQATLLQKHYPCEIQIKPYRNNQLHEVLTPQACVSCSGIIICNASEKDLEFLEQFESPVPIVLYNRYSKKYSTINMDDATIGRLPAEVFLRHGRKQPALFQAPAVFNGMNIRANVFEYHLLEAGITAVTRISVEDSLSGGYLGALELCKAAPLPDCLFCTSDLQAIGALKAFYENHISIPEQLEVIAIGNVNPDQAEYTIPSLSVINLPMEAMAGACLDNVFRSINHFNLTPVSESFPITYIARGSCPE